MACVELWLGWSYGLGEIIAWVELWLKVKRKDVYEALLTLIGINGTVQCSLNELNYKIQYEYLEFTVIILSLVPYL